jgi:hypothetical protein
MAYLEKQGYLAAVVEKWSPFPKPWGKRHDLWGFIDIIGIKEGTVVLVQATTGDHSADRRMKILSHENYAKVKASGARIIVHSWAKRGARGARKLWTCVEEEL